MIGYCCIPGISQETRTVLVVPTIKRVVEQYLHTLGKLPNLIIPLCNHLSIWAENTKNALAFPDNSILHEKKRKKKKLTVSAYDIFRCIVKYDISKR